MQTVFLITYIIVASVMLFYALRQYADYVALVLLVYGAADTASTVGTQVFCAVSAVLIIVFMVARQVLRARKEAQV